jgi:SAP domain-containing ribonucleoprotein
VVDRLDSALPERQRKRGREDKQGGRDAKRATPNPEAKKGGAQQQKGGAGKGGKPQGGAKPQPQQSKPVSKPKSVLDDPAERAKAEARAKKFGAPPAAAK